jgi:hypothetical protein
MFRSSTWTPQSAGYSRQLATVCTCLLLCLLYPLARAADLAELKVSEREGVYRISVVMQVQAPAQHVQRVLTDYPRIYRLNPSITDSEILPSPADGVVRVRTRMLDCIAFFCKEIDRVEDVRETAPGGLLATTVPALSSFKSGNAKWQVLGSGERSQVTYQAQMEPDFYIPPLVGSHFVKKLIRRATVASLERIECIARIQAGLEQNPAPAPSRVADEATEDHEVGTVLLAGGDPSGIAPAPAAGTPVGGDTGCARRCVRNDISCRR